MATKGLDTWLHKLTKRSMPVVGQVISELNKLTGTEDADLQKLAEVILRDPNMTSHVLRIANSVQYNYTDVSVNTVSRSIVLIGLKGMRAICISLLMIDNMLSKAPKERVLELMARGFHGATQAKNLVSQFDSEAAEEVFVASLLFNVGEMAFLTSEKVDESNENLFSEDPLLRRKAMEEILGTSFKAMSLGLAKYWQLGETLEESLRPKGTPSKKASAVMLGERLSRAAVKGWDSPAVAKVLNEVSNFTGLPADECMEMVKDSAEKAAEVALQYGAASVCPLIPDRMASMAVKGANEEKRKANRSKIMNSDPQLQLRILRELTASVSDKTDVNTILQMVIEGIHRGIGLERVAVCMILHHDIETKFALGEGTQTWREILKIDVGPFSENLFTEALQKPGEHWITQEDIDANPSWYDKDIKRILGCVPAFLYVVEVSGRNVAVFYADRADYGGELTKDQFESFSHFASQAEFNLKLLAQNNKRSSSYY